MKNMVKRASSLILALALAVGLSIPASASVAFNGSAKGFTISAASGNVTTTDLLDLQGVMPGDTLTRTITIKNLAHDCDYVKLYVRTEPHGVKNSPEANVGDVAKMNDFLDQLTLTVSKDGRDITTNTHLGFSSRNQYLGQLKRNEAAELVLTLSVPKTLGNDYAYQIGEVDWVFTVESYDKDGNILVHTGQENLPIFILGGLGILVIGAGAILMTKKRKHNES